MNHVYRVVWNTARHLFQVAAEVGVARAGTASTRTAAGGTGVRADRVLRVHPIALAAALMSIGAPAFADTAVILNGGTSLDSATPSTTTDYTWTTTDLTINTGSTIAPTDADAVDIFDSLTSFTNNGTLTGAAGPDAAGAGLYLYGVSVGTISNAGTIGGAFGIMLDNDNGATAGSTVGTLTNAAGATISGTNDGIGVIQGSTLTTLNNSGTISATYNGVIADSNGSIGTLNNLTGGVISAQEAVSANDGATIGAIHNAGVIRGSGSAIVGGVGSTIGTITNTGSIEGNVTIDTGDLTIEGGTGTTFGTLTGYGTGTIGRIVTAAGNVDFTGGNLLLNDTIQVSSGYGVVNSGAVLQVNQAISITGDYTQLAGTTLQIGVSDSANAGGTLSDTGYGRLVVSGNAELDPGSNVTLTRTGTSYAFASGQRYVVVDAATADYNVDALNYSATGFTGTITGSESDSAGHDDLVVSLGSGTSTSIPSTRATLPNAIASLDGLARYAGVSDAALLNLYNASMALDSTAASNRAGKQLGPVQPLTLATSAEAPTFDTMGILFNRVDAMRESDAGNTAVSSLSDSSSGSSGAGGSGISTGDVAPAYGVWGQAYGGHASQGARDGLDGYDANYGGMIIGADRKIDDQWTAGGALTFNNTIVNGNDDAAGTSTHINAYGLLGYASYRGSPWYVNVSAGAMSQHYDTTRLIDFPGFNGTAFGVFGGQQYAARAEFGYPLALAGFDVTPRASLTYSYLHQDNYTESGGNGAALAVDATHGTTVRSAIGVDIAKPVSIGHNDLLPSIEVRWIHEYDHSRFQTTSSFAGDPTGATAFTTFGQRPVSDLADVSVGVTLLHARLLDISARYELQAGGGFVSQTGSLRLQHAF
ncbi:autotransporter domain-containing protein [Pararobbsia silviterrae]|uniref:autotransporter family protein n=1 Tax=Pararobbsia silviterrae TaxID=1792498 RepID=UPI0013149A29|nr:autotransporter domain-containing protein [Pararobbsia silviterrae]